MSAEHGGAGRGPGEELIPEAVPAVAAARTAPRPPRRAIGRRGRILVLAVVLPVAAILTFAGGKLIVQDLIARSAVESYGQGAYEESLNTSGQLLFLNVIERWKPDFNMGTNYLQLGALDPARAALERSLALAAAPEQCPIRANLAITIERQADALAQAGDGAGALALYLQAIQVLDDRDPACAQDPSEPSATESKQRIEDKIVTAQQPQQPGTDPDPAPQPAPDQPDQDALDDIEGGLQGNLQEREDTEQEEREFGSDRGNQPDRPW